MEITMSTSVFCKFLRMIVCFFLLAAGILLSACSTSGSVKKKSFSHHYDRRAAYKHKRFTPIHSHDSHMTGDSSQQKELAELKDTISRQENEIKEMRRKFNQESDQLRSDLKDCRKENEAMKQK